MRFEVVTQFEQNSENSHKQPEKVWAAVIMLLKLEKIPKIMFRM
jgi:hypothetical protein